jgi:hypothetical protein
MALVGANLDRQRGFRQKLALADPWHSTDQYDAPVRSARGRTGSRARTVGGARSASV